MSTETFFTVINQLDNMPSFYYITFQAVHSSNSQQIRTMEHGPRNDCFIYFFPRIINK